MRIFAAGKQNDVPVIVGSNKDEGGQLLERWKPNGRPLRNASGANTAIWRGNFSKFTRPAIPGRPKASFFNSGRRRMV